MVSGLFRGEGRPGDGSDWRGEGGGEVDRWAGVPGLHADRHI